MKRRWREDSEGEKKREAQMTVYAGSTILGASLLSIYHGLQGGDFLF